MELKLSNLQVNSIKQIFILENDVFSSLKNQINIQNQVLNDKVISTDDAYQLISQFGHKYQFSCNKEQLKQICQLIGYKPKIKDQDLQEYKQLIEDSVNESSTDENPVPLQFAMYLQAISNVLFNNILQLQAKSIPVIMENQQNELVISQQLFRKCIYNTFEIELQQSDFIMACKFISMRKCLLILLQGTSGTGKSTIAALLGSRLGGLGSLGGVGTSPLTVLSTDSIRHIMRNYVSEDEEPIIFVSTYQCGKVLSPTEYPDEKERNLSGYKMQCQKVQKQLEQVIENHIRDNKSTIIEGVHLDPPFIQKMMKAYPEQCQPFLICVKNAKNHQERFAVRSKKMTVDPGENKYIKNYQTIWEIQNYLISSATEINDESEERDQQIPIINNANVDKSMVKMHQIILKKIRKICKVI